MSSRSEKPTFRQLRYLRALAERSGTTFQTPQTQAEASGEINRLKALTSLTKSERMHERKERVGDLTRLQPSSSIRSEEITGYGSHATWTERR